MNLDIPLLRLWVIVALLLPACGQSGAPSAERKAPSGTTDTSTSRAEGPTTAAGLPGSPVQQLLTSAELKPYWHPDQAGRVPVRIVENALSDDRPVFDLLGAPVQWVKPEAATGGGAFVKVEFQLVDGLLNLSAHYPVEGVTARATFVPDGPAWALVGAVRITEK